MLGECCSCVFVFTSRETGETVVTHLRLNWHSPLVKFYRDHSTVVSQKEALSSSTSGKTGTAVPVQLPELRVLLQQENFPHATSTLDKTGGVIPSGSLPLRDRTNSPQQEHLQTAASIKSHEVDKLEHGVKKSPNPVASSCNVPFSEVWKTVSYCPPTGKNTSKSSPSGRGCYISKFSPTGNIVALAINHREAMDTRLLFFDPLVETGLSNPAHQPKVGRKLGR